MAPGIFAGHSNGIVRTVQGIYEVFGDYVPIQIVESKRLSEDENIWLKSLRNDLEVRATNAILERRKHWLGEENGDTVIAVEVKAKPLVMDVDDHINRMEILRRRADARNDTRKFRGAIAGAIMDASVRNYAHKAGFYVIEQTGDTVKINIPEGFTPREW